MGEEKGEKGTKQGRGVIGGGGTRGHTWLLRRSIVTEPVL